MTRLLLCLAGITAAGLALMMAPDLQSQSPGDPPPRGPRSGEQRPDGPPPRFGEERDFAFQQPRPQRGQQPLGQGPRDGGFQPGRRPQGGPPRIGPLGAVIDTNQDGELSAKEIAAARDALLKLDRNRNGQIDPEEVPRREFGQNGPSGFGPPGGGGPGGGGRGPNREIVKLVKEFGANKNGYLETVERKAARESLADRPA